jgi:hypothetical protein
MKYKNNIKIKCAIDARYILCYLCLILINLVLLLWLVNLVKNAMCEMYQNKKVRYKQMSGKQKVSGSILQTMVLSSIIIGSAKNAEFKLALMSTAAGNFAVNSNESPEAVRDISKLREGDSVEIEVLAPFHFNKRQNPAGGDDIIDVACPKFRILHAEAGTETVMTGLENRIEKQPIIGKAKSPATGSDELAEKTETEDRG